MSENASLSIFGGGTDQVFRDVNVRTAGRDMFTVIQNVSLNIPPVARDPVVAIKQLNIASSDNGAGHSRTTKKGRATLGTGSVWRGLYRTFSKGPTKGGTSKSAESKESGQVCEPGVSVSSAEEAEITSFLAGGRRTSAQIYVCNMLSVGEGLPCWNPKPFSPFIPEYGISPGDVGTICARDGFKKIFNLWEGQPGPQPLWMAPSSEDRLPPNPWFSVGDTFAKGASARASFASGYPSFEFNCSGSSEGSVLAITSDAYLETLKSVSGMRDFIMQNAAELYAYAVSRGDVESNNQPLYIITGCVKADTWAMAAFDESMEAPDDTLRLVTRYDDYRGMAQNFLWTDRGRADVRCSNGGGRGLKNQSLFLRGFKLTASESIWGRGQQKEFKGPSSFERKDDFSDGRGGGRDGNHEPSFRNEGGSAGHNFTSNPKPSSYPSGRQASLNAFPYGGQLEFFHPLDVINEALLDKTGAEFALSHDDEWRFLLKDKVLDESSIDNMVKEIGVLGRAMNEKGVAILGPSKVSMLLDSPNSITSPGETPSSSRTLDPNPENRSSQKTAPSEWRRKRPLAADAPSNSPTKRLKSYQIQRTTLEGSDSSSRASRVTRFLDEYLDTSS